jgi:hypothetical protein
MDMKDDFYMLDEQNYAMVAESSLMVHPKR